MELAKLFIARTNWKIGENVSVSTTCQQRVNNVSTTGSNRVGQKCVCVCVCLCACACACACVYGGEGAGYLWIEMMIS